MEKQIEIPQSRKKWYAGNRFLSGVLLVCMVLNLVPATGQKQIKPTLYKVVYATTGHTATPYKAKITGDIVGEVMTSQVYEVIAIEGDWAKIKYKGGEYYLWKKRLVKVDEPDIVASDWAKEWFSYNGIYIGNVGEWSGVTDDWTKPVTRAEMASLLVGDIMENIYSNWAVKFTLPGAVQSTEKSFFTDTDDFYSYRLAYWGIIPGGKFNPAGTLTYDEMTTLLVKLMAYDRKYNRQGGGSELTKADIAKFGIGGDTRPNAKCTKEQAKMLCDKVLLWNKEMSLLSGVKHEKKNERYGGTVYVYDGIFTIKTMLGKKPNQPHLFVNAAGKVELSNSKKQPFKITFKKSAFTMDRKVMPLFTIQTMDGKYLGTAGTPVNGSRLIAQKDEFVWWIEHGPSEDYQWTNFIEDPNNYHQVVNVSAWKITEGTPIITWFWKHGTGSDSNNCKFIFDKVSLL